MGDQPKVDIEKMVGSIGLLIDRVGEQEEILGTVWLIDDNKVATCAHLVVPYADNLDALKVSFPTINQTFGVSRALFNPKFNAKAAQKLANDSTWQSSCAMPLQDFNAVVLKLSSTLSTLTDDQKKKTNQNLTVPAPAIEHGLGGNLSEIDFFLVVQTITNARKDGLIILSDTRNRPIARLFCQQGRITHAIYRNLVNELAFYQIVQRKFKGSFFFQSKSAPDWQTHQDIVRPTEMLLLEAHRRMDEMARLTASLGGHEAVYCRAIPWLNDNILPVEARETARNLWEYLDGTMPVGTLWQLANVDDFAVYYTLVELFKTRQIENVEDSKEFAELAASNKTAKAVPLPIVAQSPLAPGDELANLSVDPIRGTGRVRNGTLLGSLRSEDPYHLLHTMRLLPQCVGSPMFKGPVVIGMQCGPLQMNSDDNVILQQMIWGEAILECLKDGGEIELAKRLTMTGEVLYTKISGIDYTSPATKKPEPGCREVARVDCPKCGGTSLESARFCKICGQRLINEVQYVPEKKKDRSALVVVASILLITAGIVWGLTAVSAATVQLADPPFILLPEHEWLTVQTFGVNQKAKGQPVMQRIPDGAPINENILFYLDIQVDTPCYLYVLAKGPPKPDASLQYPESQNKAGAPPVFVDKLLKPNEKFTVPAKTQVEEITNGKMNTYFNALETGPNDTIILIASKTVLPLPGNQANQNLMFQKASQLLSLDRFANGIEVPLDKVAPNLIPKSVNSHSDQIYLKRLIEKIPTD